MRSKRGRPPTFTEEARRAQIVRCAIEVIAEVGYPQASVRKIAERVGVAMSVVLYHFGNKDLLVEAVIEHMFRTGLAVIVPAVDAESSAPEKLSAYIRASVEYFDSNRVQLAALTQLGTSYTPRDGRAFHELGQSEEFREQLAGLDPSQILRNGQHDGSFRGFPIESMSTALRGAVNATAEQIIRNPEFDARAYGEDLVAIFDHAVRSTR